jgi:hypothetical protein
MEYTIHTNLASKGFISWELEVILGVTIISKQTHLKDMSRQVKPHIPTKHENIRVVDTKLLTYISILSYIDELVISAIHMRNL